MRKAEQQEAATAAAKAKAAQLQYCNGTDKPCSKSGHQVLSVSQERRKQSSCNTAVEQTSLVQSQAINLCLRCVTGKGESRAAAILQRNRQALLQVRPSIPVCAVSQERRKAEQLQYCSKTDKPCTKSSHQFLSALSRESMKAEEQEADAAAKAKAA